MLKYLARRLGFVLITLLVSSMIIFFSTQVLPGDVAQMILGRFARPEAVEALRVKLGLNEPIYVQYLTWLKNFVQGDWGLSLSTNNYPVAPMVWERLKNSFILAMAAFVIYVPGGILLGLWAALRRNKAADHIISVSSLSLIGLPEFVTGVILIAIFSLKLGWLPPSSSISPTATLPEILPKLVLPAITAALVSLAYITRMTRASTVEALYSDYVRTAYLKGLSPRQVLFRHVLRNALMPTVTVAAISIGWLMGGLVVTEALFSYPGLGRLLLFAIQRRDLPLIQATTLLMAAIFCLSNMLADIIYAWLNPKIRFQ
ncbi:MAG: ABC transporter permease [Deltaproteobacteria bacterium]|jgi:peptide/nickel transport system permease protein|nr:ABC transporter permease [Deltaproteobacteria bacterium]